MAVAPLFVADLDTLKAKLRLGGMGAAGGEAVLAQAIEDVRLGFYDEVTGLGKSLVDTLLAIAYVENATTASALKRTRANSVEVAWVKWLLMQRMPTVFMDGGHITHEMWNEEPIARRQPGKAELERLRAEVLDGLAALRSLAATDRGDTMLTFEPDVLPDVPGQTIFPIVRG